MSLPSTFKFPGGDEEENDFSNTPSTFQVSEKKQKPWWDDAYDRLKEVGTSEFWSNVIRGMGEAESYKSQALKEQHHALTDIPKEIASGLSLGFSERESAVPIVALANQFLPEDKKLDLKVRPESVTQFPAKSLGMIAPFQGISALLSVPFRALGNAIRAPLLVSDIATSTAAGITGATIRQTAEEAPYDPLEIALEGIGAGVLHALISVTPRAMQFVKNLTDKQSAELLVDGIVPRDLPPNKYIMWEKEIYPELISNAREEYQGALKTAVQQNNFDYQTKLAQAKAKHEADLYELAQKRFKAATEFEVKKGEHAQRVEKLQEEYQREVDKNDSDYKNEVEKLTKEHEENTKEIEKQNQIAMEEYQKLLDEFQIQKDRQSAVNEAIQSASQEDNLALPIQKFGEPIKEISQRPTSIATPVPESILSEEIGNIFSPEKITNLDETGLEEMMAVRANDAIDYGLVRDAYKKADNLNSKITIEQPALIHALMQQQENLMMMGDKLKPVQNTLLSTINNILKQGVQLNPDGSVMQYTPLNSLALSKQAQVLRSFMDFDFAHGESEYIFKPVLGMIEDSIINAANITGNPEAGTAQQNARNMYRLWARDYNNPYIRRFRDINNNDYVSTFENSLVPDNFNKLNTILQRSNAGVQLANKIKRELVKRKIDPFIKKREPLGDAFDNTLRELRTNISSSEEKQIVDILRKGEKERTKINKLIPRAKVIEPKKEPKQPKLKEVPELKLKPKKEIKPPKVPEFTEKLKEYPEITEAKRPLKHALKPTVEMRTASKLMNITVEEAMRLPDTITGLRQLKKSLSKSPIQQNIYQKIAKDKVKDIVYKGNKEFKGTGEQLYDVVNKSENYSMLSEILGEDTVHELLQAAKKVGKKEATRKNLKNVMKKLALIHTLSSFGLL